MSGQGGIYPGPGGVPLHGEGKPVASAERSETVSGTFFFARLRLKSEAPNATEYELKLPRRATEACGIAEDDLVKLTISGGKLVIERVEAGGDERGDVMAIGYRVFASCANCGTEGCAEATTTQSSEYAPGKIDGWKILRSDYREWWICPECARTVLKNVT